MLCFTLCIYNAYCKGRIVIADSALMTLYIAILSLTMMMMTCTLSIKKIIINLATCASRQHVESNITPKFLGGSSLGEIDWSPTLIDISDILLSSSRVVMIRSSVLSSFNFKKLSFIHIRMSATQASIRDIASHLDVTSDGLNAI